MHICVCTQDCTNVSKFSLCKKFTEKILPIAGIGEIVENSLLVKISAYTVTVRIGYACSHAMPNPIVVMI